MEIPNFLDPSLLYSTATSHGFEHWIGLGITLIISTIIGGIILMVILEVFSHKFGEGVKPANAFLVVLITNIINLFGIMGILVSIVPAIGMISLILPVLVWIALIKGFFGELSFAHATIIGILLYVVTIIILPTLTSYVAAFIPSFG